MKIQSISHEQIGALTQHKPEGISNPKGNGFLDTLKDSLSQVNNLQKTAEQAVTDLVSGKDQEIHQTMIAVEKADVSFQLMMQVRNKILTAYEEISRMQI